MSILSVNAGSSSLKFALYPIQGADIGKAEVTGNIEGLEPSGQPRISFCATGQAKESADVAVQPAQDVFDAALNTLSFVGFAICTFACACHCAPRGAWWRVLQQQRACHARGDGATCHAQRLGPTASAAQLGWYQCLCRVVSRCAASGLF